MKAGRVSFVVVALLAAVSVSPTQDSNKKRQKGPSLPAEPRVVWQFEAGG